MKRLMIFGLMASTITLSASTPQTENFVREDLKELAQKVSQYIEKDIETQAIIRTRLDILEQQVKDNREGIKNNTTFMDSMQSKERVVGSAWNYAFLFAIALASSIITMFFGWLATSKKLNGKVDWDNKKR